MRTLVHIQAELIRARSRKSRLIELLDTHDWLANGYVDKWEWLREMYGQKRNEDLILDCQRQFESEGLL